MKAKIWFERTQKEKFALGAFNAGSSETLKAIVAAAKKLSSPVMIEASPREVEFWGLRELAAEVRALEKDTGVPLVLNLDHAGSFAACHEAIEAGFDYIHFDGSKLAYEENVEIAKLVVAEAHARGVLVEGEMDHIEGASEDERWQSAISHQLSVKYTDPQKAAQFVEETGVDTFASFVGNVHGLYAGEKRIDLSLLGKIAGSLPGKFLSLHGGSGVPEDQVRQAIKLGVVKINVNTELRVAFHDALKQTLAGPKRGEVAVYKMMLPSIEAVQRTVEAKIFLFGSAGKI